jgi:hypothetical protein
MKTINDITECKWFLDNLRATGWTVWQMQYRWNHPEGFHAWFMLAGHEDIEVVTKNKDVQKEIVAYNTKKPPGNP